jgi:hypothetical protein
MSQEGDVLGSDSNLSISILIRPSPVKDTYCLCSSVPFALLLEAYPAISSPTFTHVFG